MIPNFIGIGAIKTGTTSLYHYLSAHPDIHMARISPIRELDFFIEEKNWRKGLEWYRAFFPHLEKCQGEISGEYTQFPKFTGVPGRMHTVAPDARLIYIVRDPLDRIASELAHRYYAMGLPVPAVLTDLPDRQILDNSRYFLQLSQFLEHYPLSQIHILTTESFLADPVGEMERLSRFLGVNERVAESIRFQVHHRTVDKREKNRIGRWLSRNFKSHPVKKWAQDAAPDWLNNLYRSFSRNGRRIRKVTLDVDLEERLVEELRDDVIKFRDLTGVSLLEPRTRNQR